MENKKRVLGLGTVKNPQPPLRREPQVRGVMSASTYRLFARDGMPTCKLCGETFTRVEGLQKHVHRGCPSLANSAAAGVASKAEDLTASEVKVASAREGVPGTGPRSSSRGSSCSTGVSQAAVSGPRFPRDVAAGVAKSATAARVLHVLESALHFLSSVAFHGGPGMQAASSHYACSGIPAVT